MSTSFQLNPHAQSGFSKASDYDTHRPSYPSEAVNALLKNLNLATVPNAKIVELGCGTGKFTELLARREENYEILAVEPHEGMRDELVKKLGGSEKGNVRVVEGNAEKIPVEEEWGDGVIAAQAFHWFANEQSLKEINRVLKPGGVLGLIWNIEDYNSPKDWPVTSKWEQTLKDIIASTEDGTSRFRHMRWKDVFEKQLDTTPLQTLKDTFTHHMPLFSLPLGEEKIEWTVWLSDEAIWARFHTLSQIANLEGQKLEDIKEQVFQALKAEETNRNEKGELAIHGVTYLVWTSRV